jgi:hypothetical protein
MPTLLPTGDDSAMDFEVVGVFFGRFLLFSATFWRFGSELRRERGSSVRQDLNPSGSTWTPWTTYHIVFVVRAGNDRGQTIAHLTFPKP